MAKQGFGRIASYIAKKQGVGIAKASSVLKKRSDKMDKKKGRQ